MIPAVVPAAGLSVRMGRPKLLLEIAGRPQIARIIDALSLGGASSVLVVTPPADQEGGSRIAELAKDAGASVVVLIRRTPDMRSTIEAGVDSLSRSAVPPLGVLVCPADAVSLSPRLVRTVIERFRGDPTRIVVPSHEGKRGHPLALPWNLATLISALPRDVGVNALLKDRPNLISYIDAASSLEDADLDTPEDYARWSST